MVEALRKREFAKGRPSRPIERFLECKFGEASWEEAVCLCTSGPPDYFGNRDQLVHPDCPTCA